MDENVFKSWEDSHLALSEKILRGVFSIGFEVPSPIQSKAIIPLIRGKDMLAQAQSGTGKTGAFVIGVLQSIISEQKNTQAIIICPTRELAMQIRDVLKIISNFTNINLKLLIGGTSVDNDYKFLTTTPPHIIIGCPGRIYDMISRRAVHTNTIKTCILDEADEMFTSGFKDQIYKILNNLNKNIQIGLFSATVSEDLKLLSKDFLKNPVHILEKRELLTLQGIRQYYVALDNDYHKYLTIKDLYSQLNIGQSIIYCNSVNRTEKLFNSMSEEDFPVNKIHSKMSQEERNKIYDEFKGGAIRVLISTDLFSRGIDVQQVSVVINYDLPKNVHTYLHRIGRSGRWGRKGLGINLITRKDIPMLKDIEKYYNTQILELPGNYMSAIS